MVDTELLEERISASGKKKGYLCAQMGCSIQAFRLKINNITEFKLSEARILAYELGFSCDDIEKILFRK